MSLANKLSIFRILLVPFFVLCLVYYRPPHEWLRHAALWIFVLGVVTDAVDGYVARAMAQSTRLGAILDPLADKLLLTTAFLCLALISTLPAPYKLAAWVPILVVSRDVILVVGSLVIYLVTGVFEIIPSRLGKAATFAQMMTVICVLSGSHLLTIVLPVTVVLTITSGIGYLRRGNRLLNGHPTPSRVAP